MSPDRDPLERDVLLWFVPTFLLNVLLDHGDVLRAVVVAAVVTVIGVPLERRLTR